MKRVIKFFAATFALIVFASQIVSAQDDTYYDPAADAANQNQSNEPVDKTDGYGNPNDNADYKSDAPDYSESYKKDGDTYITNNYYDDDDEYLYTTRLRRYYTCNYGVSYYSYWFTPSYYFGWNGWNTSVVVSVNPWYNDPWWRWNRRHHARVIVYDPFYDPYWNWNWGWNSCAYYNTWSYPYWGYNNYNTYNYYNYGYGGYCGGGGGYYNGYRNGYNNGYNDGYWNNYYNGYNSYGYGGYRHGRTEPTIPPSNPVTVFNRDVPNATPSPKPQIDMRNVDIPKEGIQRPITTNTNADIQKRGLDVKANPNGPYNGSNPNVVGKPSHTPGGNNNNANAVRPVEPRPTDINSGNNTGHISQPKTYQPKPQQEIRPEPSQNMARDFTPAPVERNNVPQQNMNRAQPQPNSDYGNRNNYTNRNEQPQIHQENNNRDRVQRNIEPKHFEQPNNSRPDMRQEQPGNIERGRIEQPRSNPQPQQEMRRVEQPGNLSPQPQQEMGRVEQPRSNPQSQHEMRRIEQPRNNIQQSAPQQRNVNPSPGGGGFKRRQ